MLGKLPQELTQIPFDLLPSNIVFCDDFIAHFAGKLARLEAFPKRGADRVQSKIGAVAHVQNDGLVADLIGHRIVADLPSLIQDIAHLFNSPLIGRFLQPFGRIMVGL